jgi:hypothetical protein
LTLVSNRCIFEPSRQGGSAMRVSFAVIGLFVTIALAGATSGTSGASPTRAGLVKKVTIAGTPYYVIDAITAAGYIPNPTVRSLVTLVKKCPAVHVHGYWFNKSEVGLAAWIPANLLNCWTTSVSGGGPGGRPGCIQGFRSYDRATFILFAGTNSRVCPNVSTQVPGGLTIHGGAYSGWRVKCYATQSGTGRLLDYIATYSATLPASKSAGYILDTAVGGTGSPRAGIPNCFGVRIR